MTNDPKRGTAGITTETQARAKLAEVEAVVARQTRLAEREFSQQTMLAQDRLAFVKEELRRTNLRLSELEPLRGHPDGECAYKSTRLLAGVYAAIQKMMEVDLDCQAFNLEMVESAAMLENEEFRRADKYLSFREAQLKLDLSLAYYCWMRDIEAIDTILRAAMNGRAIETQSEAEEARRQQAALALREAFKDDRNMAMLTGSIAQGYAEALELMEWGISRLPDLQTRNAQVKRELLTDIKWAKLNGKVQTLMGEVAKRAKPYPALAELFPMGEDLPLPFALASAPSSFSAGRAQAIATRAASLAGAPAAGAAPPLSAPRPPAAANAGASAGASAIASARAAATAAAKGAVTRPPTGTGTGPMRPAPAGPATGPLRPGPGGSAIPPRPTPGAPGPRAPLPPAPGSGPLPRASGPLPPGSGQIPRPSGPLPPGSGPLPRAAGPLPPRPASPGAPTPPPAANEADQHPNPHQNP